jgi:two-component system NtrC family sensor kinase
LLHSRVGGEEKKTININELCDEALNLSYHSTRATLTDFNCSIEKNYSDKDLSLNIISRDISRVLLNLVNNAFYAVNEKAKEYRSGIKKGEYSPKVSVTTKRENNRVIISIRDNGNGIPQSIKDKIFTPFFTTKPAGEGTGLGLSISYDIIKSQGGQLNVESRDGEFTEFTIVFSAA